jgi:hypothetical protein
MPVGKRQPLHHELPGWDDWGAALVGNEVHWHLEDGPVSHATQSNSLAVSGNPNWTVKSVMRQDFSHAGAMCPQSLQQLLPAN